MRIEMASADASAGAVGRFRIGSGETHVDMAEKQRLAKLADGARQFEAMMLQEMLKPLNFGESPDAGGGESSGGAADTIRGFGTEAIGKAISSGRGFGLARQIIRQVTAEHEAMEQNRAGSKV